jgi:hypothetical protein
VVLQKRLRAGSLSWQAARNREDIFSILRDRLSRR